MTSRSPREAQHVWREELRLWVGLLCCGVVAQASAAFLSAIGSPASWTAGAIIGGLAVVAMTFGAYRPTRRLWPMMLVLSAQVLALIAGGTAVASWYLDRYGQVETATVSALVCDETKHGCAYHYRLRRGDGSEIPDTMPPGGNRLRVGDQVTVLEDPRAWLHPREAEAMRDSFDPAILAGAWAVTALTLAAATILGAAGPRFGRSHSSSARRATPLPADRRRPDHRRD